MALALVLSLLVPGLYFAPSAAAQQGASSAAPASVESPEEQSRRAAEIYKTTMSPFCPGRTVDGCPSPYATEWREDIRAWVSQGVPTDEIRRRLKERTDQDLTGAPSTALDAVLPILAVVLALALLGFLLRVLVRPSASKPASATKQKRTSGKKTTEQELDERLERELEQLDS